MTQLRNILRLTPRLAAFCILALAAGVFLTALTAPLAPVAHAVTPPQPKWTALTPQQQEALKPLAGEWDKIDHYHIKKWLGVAEKFTAMKADQQKRLHARMADWAKLTPEQRRAARENYKQAKVLPPEQKKAEWQQYQKLPDAQKSQLAADADAKKPVKQKEQRRAAAAQAKNVRQAGGESKTRAPRGAAATAATAPAVPAGATSAKSATALAAPALPGASSGDPAANTAAPAPNPATPATPAAQAQAPGSAAN